MAFAEQAAEKGLSASAGRPTPLGAATLGGVFAVLNLVPFAYQERRDGPSVQTDRRLALDAARTLGSLR